MMRFFLLFIAFLPAILGECLASEWVNYTSGNHVSSIVRLGDSIWAGTWGGIANIDRKSDRVTILTKASSGLFDNEITGTVVDQTGRLFVASRWLQGMDGNGWETYSSINISHVDYLYAVAVDNSNNLYVGDGL